MNARPLTVCTRGFWFGPEQTQPRNALVLQIELKLSRDANPDGLIHPRPGAARGWMNSRAGKECRRGLHLGARRLHCRPLVEDQNYFLCVHRSGVPGVEMKTLPVNRNENFACESVE